MSKVSNNIKVFNNPKSFNLNKEKRIIVIGMLKDTTIMDNDEIFITDSFPESKLVDVMKKIQEEYKDYQTIIHELTEPEDTPEFIQFVIRKKKKS